MLNQVQHDGIPQLRYAWRFAINAFCVAVGRNLVLYGGGFCFAMISYFEFLSF